MDFEKLYSERASSMRASEIRELLRVSQQPEIISFAGGLPSPDSFPLDIIRKITTDILENDGERALQYGPTEGLMELREIVADYLKKDGITATYENILVTVGSQEALDLTAKVFVNKRDVVLCGLPSYIGGINAYRAFQARLEGIPVDNDGMAVSLLEDKIKELQKNGHTLKMIYVIPTFQNPAGVVLSEDRRKHLVEIAQKYHLIIVEDDPYSKLRFEGKSLPLIKTYDDDVLYLTTFSKILSPGFRVAFVVGPKEVIRKLIIAKQSTDLCGPVLPQLIAYHFIKGNHVEKHIPVIIKMYKKKRDIMVSSMEKYFPPGIQWTHPQGGMFSWVRLPESINTQAMFQDALKEKVAYVHGAAFYVNGSGFNTMRLNFSNPSDEKIEEGIKRLAMVIKKHLR